MQTLQVSKFVSWCPMKEQILLTERRDIPEYTLIWIKIIQAIPELLYKAMIMIGIFSDYRGVFFFSVVTVLRWLVLTKHLLVYYSLLLVSANFCSLLLVLSVLSLLLAPPDFPFPTTLPTSLFFRKNGNPTKDVGQLAKLKRRDSLVGWQS